MVRVKRIAKSGYFISTTCMILRIRVVTFQNRIYYILLSHFIDVSSSYKAFISRQATTDTCSWAGRCQFVRKWNLSSDQIHIYSYILFSHSLNSEIDTTQHPFKRVGLLCRWNSLDLWIIRPLRIGKYEIPFQLKPEYITWNLNVLA